jgi:hypothetical protein
MRLKIFVIQSALIIPVAVAQNTTASLATNQEPGSPASSTLVPTSVPAPSSPDSRASLSSILDYKSVYEAATVEEEVKMAAERFNLTQSQQVTWTAAAIERRESEKQFRDIQDSKANDYDKSGAYKGLRSAHNTFHETIIGYLSPPQKEALEADRLVLNEKQRKLAKLPPPPPPAPKDTVAPVDSSAIKAAEKNKKTGKKSKKRKKPVGN